MQVPQDRDEGRPAAHVRTVALTLALLAGGLSVGAGGGGARASCGGSDFPFEFSFDGYVDAEDAHGFVVDRLRVELPTGATLLPWDPARYDLEIERRAIEVGGFVRVHGSLRLDGTVLAQSVAGVEPEFENGEAISLVAGVVEAIDGDGLTVDGHAYPFLDKPDRGPVFLMTSAAHQLPADEVRAGDAVAFRLDVDEDSGETVVGEVRLRPSGDGAVLGGRITANTMEEGGTFFAHEGLYFEVEGVRAFFPYNEDQALRAVAREHPDDSDMLDRLVEGDGVRMTGWYRDGVFFVEDLYAAGSDFAARPPRAVQAEGVVTRTGTGDIEVNGVSFRLPAKRASLRAAEPARVGDRVRVTARPPAEGDPLVARSVRALRSLRRR